MADESRSGVAGIAIVGMAGRFPGAESVGEFWQNLVNGVEPITVFGAEELRAAGVAEASLSNPDYVRARGLLRAPETFDAAFFGIGHREAALMDPQQRLFLETCWHALEDGALDPKAFSGLVGVWGGLSTGMTNNTYLLANLHGKGVLQPEDQLAAMLGNENDYLTTRVSYKLHLRGPSVNVQTACSTSLVAVAQACQALLTWQCDAALAGGVSVSYPQKEGYLYQEGGIGSPDGHCRPFDAAAAGTVFSNGVGVVLLRRLEDALADGQPIYAVIRGVATNNDGAAKVSFAAPSVEGQSEVIAMAQAAADVTPDTVGFVEAHGTGTPLGDPIEVAALTRAFREGGATGVGYCALGSVKSNMGHLDSAAGVTGLIKAALAVHHGILPATLHFAQPNPKCAIETSPFYVSAQTRPWPATAHPRRAGVSSFGIGGTNAHAVLEEAPARPPRETTAAGPTLLVWSARTASALDAATRNLADALSRPDLPLHDAAHTLRVGRQAMSHRRAVVATSREDAVAALRTGDPAALMSAVTDGGTRAIAFMFPGGGTQYVDMGRGLLADAPVFREVLEHCWSLLPAGHDVSRAIFPDQNGSAEAARRLEQPACGLPALFAVEYALARQWMAYGVRPTALIGHSMGEYVAACLAGVMSLPDAMGLVLLRGRLFETLPPGEMLGVPLAAADVEVDLEPGLAIAAVNAADSCVVAGPVTLLTQFAARMERGGVECRRLHIAVAAHSPMVEPILEEFDRYVRGIQFHAPSIPIASNVTGTWLTAAEATSADYWTRHLRQTVRFFDGLSTLLAEPTRTLIEVGPGQTLSTFARQHPSASDSHAVQPSLRHPRDGAEDLTVLLRAVGRLWTRGVPIDWTGFTPPDARRARLPLYAFDRRPYLIEPGETDRRGARQVPLEVPAQPGPPPAPLPKPSSMPITTAPPPAAAPARSRVERIADRLSEILQKLSGMSAGEIQRTASFLEMGFDSLFLTQASLRFKNEFKVKVTFRQLFEDAPTIEALAIYIDGKLPKDAFPAPAPPPSAPAPAAAGPALPAASAAPAAGPAGGGSLLERVVNEQLRLMAEQLRLLGGGVPEATSERPSAPAVQAPQRPPPEPTEAEPAASGPMHFGPFRGIDKSVQGLTPHQARHLDELVARYTARTKASKALTSSQRSRLADPRAVGGFRKIWKELVYQIATDRSAGSRMWDIDGNEYLDVTSGFGVNLFGYAVPFVDQAVREQIDRGIELGTLSPLAKEAADLICEITGMERATFANTGSEAIAGAIRAVRTATGREWVAVFDDEYHGIAEEVLVKSVGPRGRTRSAPAAPGIPDALVERVIVLHYDDPASLDIIRERAHELAAVIIEPVQNRHPDFRPTEMIRAVRQVTAECDVPLIFDEMITGFRLHPRGAQGYFGVDVDVACYGKIMSGGLPIAAIAGKAQYLDAFDGGPWQFGDDSFPEGGVTFFGGTFTRNPLSLAAAVAALRHLRSLGQPAYDDLNAKSDRFADEVNTLFRRYQAPMRLEHCGSVCNIIFTDDNPLPRLLYYFMRLEGIHIWDRPFFVSMIHTEAELQQVVRAFDASLTQMQAAHFLGQPSPDGPDGGRGPSGEIVPFTDGQMEVWLAEHMGTGASTSFNEVVALDISGHLNLTALERAVSDLVARHESFRMVVSDDPPGFRLLPGMAVPVARQDVSALAPAAADAEVARLIEAENTRPFDLSTGPALRVSVIRRGTGDVLVLSVHHLVCDGWSFGTALRDLGAFYAAAAAGGTARLPAAYQASAFAAAQLAQRQSEQARDDEAYWMAEFATLPDPLELPGDRQRPPVNRHAGGRVGVLFDKELGRHVSEFATGHRTTTFTTLLAAFEAFISRLSGQTDFVVGVPMAGQSLLEEEGLVAHCVNFLPIRARVDPSVSFASHVAAATRRALDVNDHQEFTYLQLLRALRLPRATSRDPLVSISFTVEPSFADPSFGGVPARVMTVPRATSKRDLHVNMMETPEGLLVETDYNADLFDPATIRAWMEAYRCLLTSALAAPSMSISALPMMRDDERQRVTFGWNQTDATWPSVDPLAVCCERWARTTPDAPAVACEDTVLSWAEFNGKANQLARHLQGLGVRRGDIVGIALERSAEFLVALLAAHKAGAAFLPLDPQQPVARLREILGDASPRVVVTSSSIAPSLHVDRSRTVWLDRDASALARHAVDDLGAPPALDDRAYVIYTSGTTGQPKGVVIEHGHLVNYTWAVRQRLGVADAASYAFVSTVAADLGLTSIAPALASGGCVHVFTAAQATDARAFAEYSRQHPIDVLKITPTHLAALLDSEADPALLPRRCLVLGGEALRPKLLARIRGIAPDLRVLNHYGPTETTVGALTWLVPAVNDEAAAPAADLPIGSPLQNYRAYILDAAGTPVPPGVSGELYIGGKSVARGYWNRPELTASRFLPDPFASTPDARMYRTGDRARWSHDGLVHFLGRVDHQVKVRGFRIELGEVEAAMRAYPGVDDAVAALVADADGESSLVGYVKGALGSTAGLRDFLRDRLPDAAVPSALVVVAAWPRNPNGKIDRAALPMPEVSPREEAPPVGVASATERTMAGIWSRLLGGASVGPTDDFFHIGGHSLLAIRLAHEIQVTFGVRLPPVALFRYPVLADLARHVDSLQVPIADPDAPAPPRPPRPSPLAAAPERAAPAAVEGAAAADASTLLARLAPGGSGSPFCWVHGLGGEVFSYMRVSKHLSVHRPVYGFAADWTAAFPPEQRTVAQIAAAYVRELKAAIPRGPYHIGGFCSAGMLVLEMVRQLEEAGEPVGAFAILDFGVASETPPAGVMHGTMAFLKNLPLWIRDDALPSGAGDLAGRVRSKVRRLVSRKRNGSNGARADVRDETGMWKFPDSQVEMLEVHRRVLRAYVPRAVGGKVSLFLPRTAPLFGPYPEGQDTGWEQVAGGGVRIYSVPGSHSTMLAEPFAAELATQLEQCIVEAEAALSQERRPAADAATALRLSNSA